MQIKRRPTGYRRETDGPEIDSRLERALRESRNKSFQLFHVATKDEFTEAIRKLDLSIPILRYVINNPLPFYLTLPYPAEGPFHFRTGGGKGRIGGPARE